MVDPNRAPRPGDQPPSLGLGPPASMDAIVAFMLFLAPQPIVAGLFHDVAGLSEMMVGSIAMLTGCLCVLVFTLIKGGALRLCLRPRLALTWYVLFMLVWFPLSMWLYPIVMRALGYDLPRQLTMQFLTENPAGLELVLVLILACVMAPIVEELVFRGFLFRACERQFDGRAAVVLTSLLFGLLHETSVIVPITLLGCLFGFIRLKTGGVGSSILIHVVHNTWTVLLALSSPELVDMVFDK